jgi:hypothetical protein
VFDKLGKHLNPSKSQFSDDGPNVLLVSCTGHGVRADHPGIGWALDELFCAQPKLGRTTADETLPDISLGAWVDYRANELMSEGKMKPDWYLDHSNDVIAAPRRLGAILLFDGCRLSRSRINYNVKDCCLVSHGEMVELEEIFNNQVPYWR